MIYSNLQYSTQIQYSIFAIYWISDDFRWFQMFQESPLLLTCEYFLIFVWYLGKALIRKPRQPDEWWPWKKSHSSPKREFIYIIVFIVCWWIYLVHKTTMMIVRLTMMRTRVKIVIRRYSYVPILIFSLSCWSVSKEEGFSYVFYLVED